MWPIVGEQWEGNAAQFLGPRLQAGRGIGADVEDLAVQLLEFIVVRTEPVDLVRSPAGESERHERDYDRPALEAGEDDLLVCVRREREVGRRAAYFRFQSDTPSCVSRQSRHRRIPARRAVGNCTHHLLIFTKPDGESGLALHQPLTPAIILPINPGGTRARSTLRTRIRDRGPFFSPCHDRSQRANRSARGAANGVGSALGSARRRRMPRRSAAWAIGRRTVPTTRALP